MKADFRDRFHRVADAIDREPRLRDIAAYAQQAMREKLVEHRRYVIAHGIDMPEAATENEGPRQRSGYRAA